MAQRAIEAALTALLGARRAALAAYRRRPALPPESTVERPETRAAMAARLRSLERDVAEVKSRVNGLLFLLVGTVLSELLLRLMA